MYSYKKLKKRERGSFDYRCDGTVYVSKWNDNSIVHIFSNYSTHLPVRKCKRRVKGAARSRCNSASSLVLTLYNKRMSEVDLMERLLSSYRPTIRGKKWYWPVFTNMLNIAVVPAWRSHCATNNTKLSHLEFLRHITMTLLQSETQKESRALKGAYNVPTTWIALGCHKPYPRHYFTRQMQGVYKKHKIMVHKMPN